MHISFKGALLASAVCALAPAAQAETMVNVLRGLTFSETTRVVGGEIAAEGAWPWQTVILIPVIAKGEKTSSLCGGSVIASQWILSAAHCFVPEHGNTADKSRKTRVLEGLKRIHKGPKGGGEFIAAHDAAEIFVHPDYNMHTHENDIALVHLREKTKVESVAPLLRPEPVLESPPSRAIVTGWGQLHDVEEREDHTLVDVQTHEPVSQDALMPDRLMQVELPLVGVADCKAANSKTSGVIDARTLCAAVPEGGKDSCQGDSGGPLVSKRDDHSWTQIGVVSWGVGCGRRDFPGVYTRVSAFADWMKSVMGKDLVVVAQDPQPQPKPQPQPEPEPQPNPALDNVAGVAINFEHGDRVRAGDRVAYQVSTRKAGYLAIFDATPDGKLTQVFPNAKSVAAPGGARVEAARLTPERPMLIPNYKNPYRGFDVRITDQRGKGAMVAILSDEPLTSLEAPSEPKTFSSQEQAMSALERLRKELERNLVLQGQGDNNGARAGQKPNWSVDVREYFVE